MSAPRIESTSLTCTIYLSAVSTSKDGLHGRIAPLLITERQCFVHGDDLKRDLARLNVHYEGLPEAEKQKARCTTRAILRSKANF